MSAPRPANLVIDCNDLPRVVRFWSALLELPPGELDDDWADLAPLGPQGPVLSFQRVPEGKAAKNRLHLDLGTPDVVAAGKKAEELGATPASKLYSVHENPWQVWRDPEGNEFCLVTT